MLSDDGIPVLLVCILLRHHLQYLAILGNLLHKDAHARDGDPKLLGYVFHEVLFNENSMGYIQNLRI